MPPTVTWFKFDTQAALALCASIVTSLFQTECMHAQHSVITGHTCIPVWERTRDAISQHAGIAGEEVDLMSRLQGQSITRVTDAQILENQAGCAPSSLDEQTNRLQMLTLAIVCGERL